MNPPLVRVSYAIWLQVDQGLLDAAGKLAGESWAKHPDDWSSFRISMDCLLPSTADPARNIQVGIDQLGLSRLLGFRV
jgi:hypothetical protein